VVLSGIYEGRCALDLVVAHELVADFSPVALGATREVNAQVSVIYHDKVALALRLELPRLQGIDIVSSAHEAVLENQKISVDLYDASFIRICAVELLRLTSFFVVGVNQVREIV